MKMRKNSAHVTSISPESEVDDGECTLIDMYLVANKLLSKISSYSIVL